MQTSPSAAIRQRRRNAVLIGALLLLVTVLASVIRWQGWRSNVLINLDMLPYNVGAANLLRFGQVPDRGDIGGYLSYNPPGTVYLMVPGILIFKDPRLWEVPGTFLMNLIAVAFLYLIAAELFGRGIGIASAIAFGFSFVGAPSILPIGHSAFLVATLYFLLVWIRKHSPWALTAAIVVCGFGLYVDLGILPILPAFPVLWILFRPPISLKGCAIAAIVAAAIWFPFLRFEASRSFVDLRSILLLRPVPAIVGGLRESAWEPCTASLPGRSGALDYDIEWRGPEERVTEIVASPEASLRAIARYRLCRILVNLDRNFDGNFFLLRSSAGLGVALWMSFISGLTVLMVISGRRFRVVALLIDRIWSVRPHTFLIACLLAALAIWIVLSPALLARCCTGDGAFDIQTESLLRQLRAFIPLLLVSIALGARLSERWGSTDTNASGPVAVGFFLPWLLLLIIAEPSRSMRLWWLWPIEILCVVIGIVSVGHLLPCKKPVGLALLTLGVVLTLPREYLQQRIERWRDGTYAGRDTGQLATVDLLGAAARASGRSTMTIGYDIDAYPIIHPFFAATKDPLYRRGAWFDFLLRHRWGVLNANTSVDGLTDVDQYRVQQSRISPTSSSPWSGFEQLAAFGMYSVFRRGPP